MKHLFDELSFAISKLTTRKYSTSFSMGILALKPSIRLAIYSIYGYVRLVDEIVDSFHDYDKEKMLKNLKRETDEALNEKISLNPILNSFQHTVHKYNIGRNLIDEFLQSMEMDLKKINYDSNLYKTYIHGSAEVVGLMCLKVFTEGNQKIYEDLKSYAMKLGSAFQKINFLRDLKNDYWGLGRTYFPNLNVKAFNNQVKVLIENEIENEFKEALVGIKKLPHSSLFGVYLAYKYYFSLFKKIKSKSSNEILIQRIRVPNTEKAWVAFKSYLRHKTTFY
ncbi:phytoene/squalene synthase family protein [Apibacter muscae]|uniref:Phytoene/squalene synthase family protein n=1 Tax=Apibacter muscae TaxID=2509004 RepID=A0A563D9K3_9FLAO|nr:phytoene/squalene synthase family protein [Apibacter muscae]TWP26782.1 phytoene/squalene synthase family protein [Apibacter muscae]